MVINLQKPNLDSKVRTIFLIIIVLFLLLWFLVKTWNGERSFVDREAEQDKINGVKRSFDDEYNEDFDRGVVSIFK